MSYSHGQMSFTGSPVIYSLLRASVLANFFLVLYFLGIISFLWTSVLTSATVGILLNELYGKKRHDGLIYLILVPDFLATCEISLPLLASERTWFAYSSFLPVGTILPVVIFLALLGPIALTIPCVAFVSRVLARILRFPALKIVFDRENAEQNTRSRIGFDHSSRDLNK